MRVKLTRAELARVLNATGRVVEASTTIPILSHVLLEAENSRLTAKGTNLDQSTSASAEASVDAPGAACLPAKTLAGIAAKLPANAEVEIAVDDGAATVKSGRSRFKLQTFPVDDFPDLGAGDFAVEFTLSAADAKFLFGKTLFAVSTEETRFYLNGTFLHVVGGKLVAVATDGHRLARMSIDLPAGVENLPAGIIPRHAVAEIIRLATCDLRIAMSTTKIRVTAGDVVFTSKLIDGTFPDYQRIIPKGGDKSGAVGRKAFADSLARVSAIATGRGRAVRLALGEGALKLSITQEGNTSTDEMDVAYNGDSFEIGFNSKYLADILAHTDGDDVSFRFGESGTPALFGDEKALFVLMPMRL